jgi:electron transfer flavoprotein alpha subunit
MSNDVFVVVEQLNGKISDITFEMLGKGREMADALGGKLCAVLLGDAMLATQLGKADVVLSISDASLANYTPSAFQNALVALMTAHQPALTMIGNTSMGMDLASASATLGIPLIAYCNNMRIEAGKVIATAQIYGGKLLARTFPRLKRSRYRLQWAVCVSNS